MFHPLEDDLSKLKDSEIESKLQELSRKYFQASRLGNQQLLTQISTFVTIYRDELFDRQRKAAAAINSQNTDDDLGRLINVD